MPALYQLLSSPTTGGLPILSILLIRGASQNKFFGELQNTQNEENDFKPIQVGSDFRTLLEVLGRG